MGYLIDKIKIENPSMVTQFPYEQKNVEGKLYLLFPI